MQSAGPFYATNGGAPGEALDQQQQHMRDDQVDSFADMSGWHQPLMHANAMSLQNSVQNLSRSFGAPPATSSCGVRKSMVMKQIQKEQRRQQSSNSRSGYATAAQGPPAAGGHGEDAAAKGRASAHQQALIPGGDPQCSNLHHSFYVGQDERSSLLNQAVSTHGFAGVSPVTDPVLFSLSQQGGNNARGSSLNPSQMQHHQQQN